MVTISRVVEKYVRSNAFIQEALRRGIINYAALAEEIKPLIETEMKEKVKESAVMMALRRLQENMHAIDVAYPHFSKDADLFIKSDLFEITVRKSDTVWSAIKKIYELANSDNDFLVVSQGLTQFTVISNRRYRTRIKQLLKNEKVIREIDKLAALSTALPDTAVEEIGHFYIITRAFAWESISIIEMVSTLTELTLILHEKDIPKSFALFKELIENNS